MLIGDGFQYLPAMRTLKDIWMKDGDSSQFHAKLVESFELGVVVDWVAFPTDDRDHRLLWYTSATRRR